MVPSARPRPSGPPRAAGCCLLHPAGQGVGIAAATFGRVEDYQIKDINNMGAAMAPAAAATLLRYLHDTGQEPKDFDAIYTGDLGHLGSRLFREILTAEGLVMKNHIDCGSILYDAARQNVKSGGSGPAAVPPSSAGTSCRGWSGGAIGGCCSSPPGRL